MKLSKSNVYGSSDGTGIMEEPEVLIIIDQIHIQLIYMVHDLKLVRLSNNRLFEVINNSYILSLLTIYFMRWARHDMIIAHMIEITSIVYQELHT